MLNSASKEDDCIKSIHKTLFAISKDGNFSFPRTINMALFFKLVYKFYTRVFVNWDINFKPKTQQKTWNMSFPETSNSEEVNPELKLPKHQ